MKTELCCDTFERLIPVFGWFTMEGKCLMPHIDAGEQKMRVNHCPSCGERVRDLEIPREEVEEVMKQSKS